VVFDLERAWKDIDDSVLQIGNKSLAGTFVPKTATEVVNTSAESNIVNNNKIPRDFRFELVLRKWCNLHPSMEFRCFVWENELGEHNMVLKILTFDYFVCITLILEWLLEVAISQRHPSKYYAHLQKPSREQSHPLICIIQKFFSKYVRNRFSGGHVHRYVLDLYVDSQERAWILDFNVWGTRTDGLLFDWKELAELGPRMSNTARYSKSYDRDPVPSIPEFRVVTEGMKTMTYDPLSSFRGPTDVLDLLGSFYPEYSSSFAENPSFEDFMKLCVHPSEI
jgi:hypothetical protein